MRIVNCICHFGRWMLSVALWVRGRHPAFLLVHCSDLIPRQREHACQSESSCCLPLFHGGQNTVCRSRFSPSTVWLLGIELRSLGLTAGTLPAEPAHIWLLKPSLWKHPATRGFARLFQSSELLDMFLPSLLSWQHLLGANLATLLVWHALGTCFWVCPYPLCSWWFFPLSLHQTVSS